MTVKATARTQYQNTIDKFAAKLGQRENPPSEGWIATARKALGMSGAQLASRLGVTRARVSQVEHAEREGGVTLKSMHAVAEAMGCRFVYAIVPDRRIEDIIAAQARKKARALVERASTQMALEDQALSEEDNAKQTERIAQDLFHTVPPDLWKDK